MYTNVAHGRRLFIFSADDVTPVAGKYVPGLLIIPQFFERSADLMKDGCAGYKCSRCPNALCAAPSLSNSAKANPIP